MPSELGDVRSDSEVAYNVYYGDAKSMLPWVKSLGIDTVEALREHFDAEPQRRVAADQWRANIEKYGSPTWDEWCCEQWGTKWNACDAEAT
jgi:hypothetical protein